MDTVIAIANEIILREAEAGRSLDAVRLHKLLYFVQVSTILEGEQAFFESFEAWENGPMLAAFRDWVKGKGNFRLDRPFTGARVEAAHIVAAITFVIAVYGPMEREIVVDTSHKSNIYERALAQGRNTVLNMNNTISEYTKIHPLEPLIPTPLHRVANKSENEIIAQLNDRLDNEELLEELSESNYGLVMSLVKTHRQVLSGYAMADVVHGIARHWWAAPQEAVNMLRVALRSDENLVQEQALKGLALILRSDWDEDVAVSTENLTEIKRQIRRSLSDDQVSHIDPILKPYLTVTYSDQLVHA